VREHTRKEAILALSIGLGAWGFFLVVENAWFAAPAFNVSPPFWAAWVGQIPIWGTLLIDTIAVAAIIALLLLERTRQHRHRLAARGVGAIGAILILLAVAVVASLLFTQFHITFQSLNCGLQGFFGRSC
jgi:hypothetical protein